MDEIITKKEKDRIKIQILQSLANGKKKSIYEIIDLQDSSLNEFFEIFKELQRDGYIVSEFGKVKSVKDLPYKYFEVRCNFCDGTGFKIDGFFSNILKKFKEITKDRPEALDIYDQGFISSESIVRRLQFIYERGDIYGKIFVVGDDDLFSVASALTGFPEKIVVVDIDRKLIDYIDSLAKKHSLNIEAFVYDVQDELPKDFKKNFDLFVSDPVETIPGITLFLSRGVEALKGVGSSGYFGITTLEASRKKWYEIEKIIHEMGFVVTDIIRKFSVYPEDEKNFFKFQEKLPIVKNLGIKSDYNWYKSSFLRIEAVLEPKPLIEGKVKLDEKIYRDDESWATPI
ncbi:MAG: bis-aminopropyl spermidine synthase family protein [Archaeoglobaceae archaeon]|nr:bis-aminopropyl spermidine synthase family protein [Archaeoglobaceae archaeon]MCX8152333.1 bis-aminopropyl spermidine synthase family protein [Archaeoglobaceae archaeon]MDW8013639.1 bis-aminopropyl spermidine synthase family protein [Archaeoglobaceae archaeon]